MQELSKNYGGVRGKYTAASGAVGFAGFVGFTTKPQLGLRLRLSQISKNCHPLMASLTGKE